MTTKEFKSLALSFAGAIENPHFDRTAFKINGKKIFATLHEENQTANLKLSQSDQAMYCAFDKQIIYPVPNKWGLQGWTIFELKKVSNGLVLDALANACREAMLSRPKKK